MTSKKLSDLLDLESGIPTTAEDVRALRESRAQRAGDDWLDQLQRLADQFPASYEDLERRPTFEGCEPFEL
jgi:hypothetical protein